MIALALKILLGDKAKYIGLIFGVTFATLLMSQQVSLFIGLMGRTGNFIWSISDIDLWVMNPKVKYIEEIEPMRDVELFKVRSIKGIQQAIELYKGVSSIRLQDGLTQQVQLIGIDSKSMTGMPSALKVGDAHMICKPETGVIDENGYVFIWPNQKMSLPKTVELNDFRIRIEGVCDVLPTFFTFPLLYVSYKTALAVTPPSRNKLSFILVKLQKNISIAKTKKLIQEKTGLTALTPKEFAWRSIQHVLQRTGIAINFGITIFLGILIGAAITAQTFYIFVIENLKQFAAMKAIGFTNRQLLNLVFIQAAFIAFIGYGIGIGLTAFFFKMTSGTPALKGFFLYTEVILGSAFAIFVVVCFSVIFSLRKVFSLDPSLVFKS